MSLLAYTESIFDNIYYVTAPFILFSLSSGVIKTPFHGVQTTLFCCLADRVEGGAYYADCAKAEMSPHAKKDADAEALWDLSERLVQCRGAPM